MILMRGLDRLSWRVVAGALLISVLTGCNREEARIYHVPKEVSTPSQSVAEASSEAPPPQTDSMPSPAPSLPHLTYQLPEGWQEKPPSEMRVASITVSGKDNQSADVSAIPLSIVGRDRELVNMWRSQVQLPPTDDPDAIKQFQPVAIGMEQGRLFDFTSEPMPGKPRQRMFIAMLTRGSMSWFFKMTGEEKFVGAQKEKFLQFLKSISFTEKTSTPAVSPSEAAPEKETGSIWTVPADWQSMPPAQFLLAQFSIPGPHNEKAEVNVARLNGDGGGLSANANRWRGQLGLETLGENELAALVKPLEMPEGKASLVDFTGKDVKTGAPARLIGVAVTQEGQTWFYKLMGDPRIVAQQEKAFVKFIQSANYANAR